ncbi:MAG TPA: chemotaxis protein CheW [Anaeromyxobacteraceae bacterium]|nr:chemotaxis protein CheW [Anaeromyxobacteraceae bacterium]
MPGPREQQADAQGGGGRAATPPEAWFFCLRILGGRYAFEAPLVTEVVRLGPLTRLPAAPSFLPGVFTHRGEVLPVLDISQLVGHSAVAIRPSTRAAIVHCGPWKVAVVSDAVEGLVAIPRRALEPPPAESTGVAEFMSAVARDRAGAIAILDLPRMVEAARARAVPAGSAPA